MIEKMLKNLKEGFGRFLLLFEEQYYLKMGK